MIESVKQLDIEKIVGMEKQPDGRFRLCRNEGEDTVHELSEDVKLLLMSRTRVKASDSVAPIHRVTVPVEEEVLEYSSGGMGTFYIRFTPIAPGQGVRVYWDGDGRDLTRRDDEVYIDESVGELQVEIPEFEEHKEICVDYSTVMDVIKVDGELMPATNTIRGVQKIAELALENRERLNGNSKETASNVETMLDYCEVE